MAQAVPIPTTSPHQRQPIAAPADAAEAHRLVLHRLLWADFGLDGRALTGSAK